MKLLSIALNGFLITDTLAAMATRPRTRLAPDARRDEILDHARRLFGARSYATVSSSEIARSAGVTPGLVSHYFPGGKREIFLALIPHLASRLADAIHVDPTGPVDERVAMTVEQWLEWLNVNRETWLATAAQGDYIADPDLQAVVDAGLEHNIDALMADFADVLSDDRRTRLLLRCWLGFNRACSRSWLNGDATRSETALLLTATLQRLVTEIAPALAALED